MIDKFVVGNYTFDDPYYSQYKNIERVQEDGDESEWVSKAVMEREEGAENLTYMVEQGTVTTREHRFINGKGVLQYKNIKETQKTIRKTTEGTNMSSRTKADAQLATAFTDCFDEVNDLFDSGTTGEPLGKRARTGSTTASGSTTSQRDSNEKSTGENTPKGDPDESITAEAKAAADVARAKKFATAALECCRKGHQAYKSKSDMITSYISVSANTPKALELHTSLKRNFAKATKIDKVFASLVQCSINNAEYEVPEPAKTKDMASELKDILKDTPS